MHALHHEIHPPSGVEYVCSLKLTQSTVSVRHELAARVLCNVVVARENILRIFEVREELAEVSGHSIEERERQGKLRKDTEAVEGETSMDRQGDGFVNIAKPNAEKTTIPTVTKFYFIREHKLQGIVTGMGGVKTVSSLGDKLDRLLISFRDAKLALLEWSEETYDLVAVSIHTYERAPQVMLADAPFRSDLRVDPYSRCAALSLPRDSLAILPFYQSQQDIDMLDTDHDHVNTRILPYSPSFILDLPASVAKHVRNITDFVFLPGFTNPTIALLFQTVPTWTGRLKEFKDTFKLVIFTLDIASQGFPIITSVEGLPHDCFSLQPTSTALGGLIVLAGNSIIYVDQVGRRVTLPVNGWAAKMSDVSFAPPDRDLHLEGARALMVADRAFLLILKDGTIYPVDIVADGKMVSKLVMGQPLAQTAGPSALTKIDDELMFIGSLVGPSTLARATKVEEEIPDDAEAQPVVKQDIPMDLDDEDLYGAQPTNDSGMNGASAQGKTRNTRTVLHLSFCDSLHAHGPISGLTFATGYNGERPVAELVAATGVEKTGGFTVFQNVLPAMKKGKLHAIGGIRGMWSLPIRQPVKSGGASFDRSQNPFKPEHDTLIISTDAIPSPGLSRIAVRSSKTGEVNITTRIQGTTIGAAPFFGRTAILHVMSNSIRVLEPDGSDRQNIKDMDGGTPRPKIRSCSIVDPYVLISREDDTIGLFIDTDRGKIRRKDMSPMGDKTSKYLCGCFFTDHSGLFKDALRSASAPTTTTIQGAMAPDTRTQWLVLVRPQGVLEIWSLPKLQLVYSTDAFSRLETVVTDSHAPVSISTPAPGPPRQPQEMDIEQIMVAPLGETSPELHLFVFLRCGQVGIYRVLGSSASPQTATPRASSLSIKFIKIFSKAFELQRNDVGAAGILAEHKRISRTFIPFSTTHNDGPTYTGVFLTGENPSWILSTDKGGLRLYPSGHNVVHAFTPCSLWDSRGDFLLYTDEGQSVLEWVPDFVFDGPMPVKNIPLGRTYAHIAHDVATGLIVAAATLETDYVAFDEDAQKTWEPDAPYTGNPRTETSALELLSPDVWATLDGYEFAFNEVVMAVEIVTLETLSTENEKRPFIAVGTSINRGEDLATKGCTYIFDIVEVVPDHTAVNAPKRWYKLRLLCRDEAKGPVTSLCGFDGYLVSSMGQKLYVRAFDQDERLVGVAFLDVGVYVTSLRSLKNLLLVGDAVKSTWFVAFQEDPYKLVVLGKDLRQICTATVDFLFRENELAFVSCDEDGVIRLYAYDPQDPESRDGRGLLLRSEYMSYAQYRASTRIAVRPNESEIPEERLFYGGTNGSICRLVPLEDVSSKRLELLQGQVTRHLQHTAALNPKVFRIVRNDFESKPLTKGILDGNLLAQFVEVSTTKQVEMTKQIGTDRTTALMDWTQATNVLW